LSLATFVQISDLHVGLVDPTSSNARTAAWMRWPYLDGLLGHSGMSLRHLANFVKNFKRTNPEGELIVTGDLTTRGDPQEYDIANEFISDKLRPPQGAYIGLGDKNWTNRGIPGNHDHWPGINPPPPTALPMLGPSHLDFAQIFPGLPKIDPIIQLATGQRLQFLRIDTDVDVDPNDMDRILARGLFVSHLTGLEQQLAKPSPDEIRVLCLHHSRQYKPTTRLLPILEIDGASRKALDAFLSKHRISVLLCGHIHRPPALDLFKLKRSIISTSDVLEVRCGTTTQIDLSLNPKPAFLTFRHFLKPHWPNTLVVHEVLWEQGKIMWSAELYVEDRENGFQPAPQGKFSFPVWP